MLNDLLPANSGSWREKDYEKAAQLSLKSGNYPRAVAILATGYERGGPAVFLEWAYTYLHYLLISRRMLRRGARRIGQKLGGRMLQSFSTRYSDAFLDRLEGDVEPYLVSRVGEAREPSGALLLMAEMRFADGETAANIVPILPRAETTLDRARFVTARTHLASDAETTAEPLLLQTVRETDSAVAELQTLGRIARRQGRISDAAIFFNRSLRASYAPTMPSDMAPGEVRFLSTILEAYDIYASSAGFTIVKKGPSQVGVVMFGDTVFEVLNTPGYRQWRLVKRVLGRILDLNRLRSWTIPERDRLDERYESSRGRLSKTVWAFCETISRLPGLFALRSTLSRLGFGRDFLKRSANRLRALPRPSILNWRPGVKGLLLFLVRTALGRWIAAREVPAAHQTRDVQEIFRIISRIENA